MIRMLPGPTVLWLVAVVLLLAPTAVAEDKDTKAGELYAKYRVELKASRDISDGDGWNAFVRRLNIVRALGPLDCPRSGEALLKIARSARRIDDRLLAAQGLAQHGDLAAVKSLVDILAHDSHPAITEAVADELAANTREDVGAWLTQAVATIKNPAALAIILRAGRGHALAPEALAAHFDQKAAKPATVDLAFDALKALAFTRDASAAPRILAAAVHTDMRLRLAAADVLPSQPRMAASDAAMRKLLGDDNALVRYAMLMAMGEAKLLSFVPEISERLADDDRRTRKTALDVLRRISGKDFGFDMGAWRRWHETKDGGAMPGTLTVPSYHGVPIWSERLAFILDRSGSMLWPADPPVLNRMAVAKSELQRVLGILPKGTLFNVLAFDGKVYSWRNGEASADPKTIARAGKWVGRQESKRKAYTNTYAVLERAITDNPQIDTLYVLSDGIPEWGDVISREGLLAAVHGWNRYRRVTINTFAITHMRLNPGKYPRRSSMRRAETFMRDLARAGGGTYTFVRPPKK